MLDGAGQRALDATPVPPIAHALLNGMVSDLTVEQHARDFALPQFQFHLMTTCATLCVAGLPLGKADYVALIFAYRRQETKLAG